jgi:WD40 repeat protein
MAIHRRSVIAGFGVFPLLAQRVTLPDVKPKVPAKPAVFSIAWHPQGTLLALGGFREVRLVDPATGRAAGVLAGHAEAVRALAFSLDGKRLAAGGGVPGRKGEIKIWDVESRAAAQPITGHSDCIYSLALSPDGKTLATSSYDKVIQLWDAATGKEMRTLRDHIDSIYALAFTPDGRRLVSGAADRAVKVWNPETGERLYTMSEPLDGINTVAISPDGKLVAAGGLDKSIRIWELCETSAPLVHSLMAHEDAILKLAWSPDGKTLISSAADRTIKVLRSSDLKELRTLAGQPDWAYGVGFSPDGKFIAVGRMDGSLSLYDTVNFQDALDSRRASR